jgi:AcrR family transcriptional regulator
MTKPPPVISKAQQTRQKIIEASIRIIASQGIEKATTRAISKEANVANGLVTHYLKSQDELFSNVVQAIAEAAYREIETAPENLPAPDKIMWMCEKNIDFFLTHPDYAKCFLLFYYYASIQSQFRGLNDALDKRAVSRLTNYFDQLSVANSKEAAIITHSHIVSSVIRYYSVPQTISKELYREEFLNRCSQIIQSLK